MTAFTVLLLLATMVQSSTAYPSGHPDTHCDQKTPNHGQSSTVQGGGSAFQVTATQTGACSIRACVETMPNGSQPDYAGFFLKALRCDNMGVDFANYIGSFSLDSNTTVAKIICPGNSAVTHIAHNHLTQLCATWTQSGGTCPSCANLCATVVRSYELYHYDVCTTVMLQVPTTDLPLVPTSTRTACGNTHCKPNEVCRVTLPGERLRCVPKDTPPTPTTGTACGNTNCKPNEVCRVTLPGERLRCVPKDTPPTPTTGTACGNTNCKPNEVCRVTLPGEKLRCVLKDPTTAPPTPTRTACGNTHCLPHQECQVTLPREQPECIDTCNHNGPCGATEACRLRNDVAICLSGCKPRKVLPQRLDRVIGGQNCTSIKPIGVKVCDGFCSSGRSCQVTKTRKKTFPFRCPPQQSKRKYAVTLATKCKCQ